MAVNWRIYVTGPEHVPRPYPGDTKYIYFINDYTFAGNVEQLWPKIVEATEEGLLGYYAGLSPDKHEIAVHHSEEIGPEGETLIKQKLAEFGVNPILLEDKHIEKIEVNDLISWREESQIEEDDQEQ